MTSQTQHSTRSNSTTAKGEVQQRSRFWLLVLRAVRCRLDRVLQVSNTLHAIERDNTQAKIAWHQLLLICPLLSCVACACAQGGLWTSEVTEIVGSSCSGKTQVTSTTAIC